MKTLLLELEFQQADFERLQKAWRQLIARHPLLHSHIDANQQLQTVEQASYTIQLYDLSLQSAANITAVQNKLREANEFNAQQWPWFDIKATRYQSGNIRVYFQCAAEMLAPMQIHYLLRELVALYQNPELPLHSLTLQKPEQATETNEHAFTLRYKHLIGHLGHNTLTDLREKSIEHNIALPIVLLNAFKDELDRQNYQYPVYMTLANRFPFYPFMYDRALFATSVAGCEIKDIYNGKFVDNCTKIDAQLRKESGELNKDNLDELIKLPPNIDALSLFSCALEQDLPTGPLFAKVPDIIYCNFNLPTVDIDYNVWEQGGQLMYRWSYAKALPQINSNTNGSLLRGAIAEYPELKEVLADNDAAIGNGGKGKNTGIKAASAVLAGTGGAGVAKGLNKNNNAGKIGALGLGGLDLLQQSQTQNGLMDTAFDKYGKTILTLSDSDDKWQEEKDSNQNDEQNEREQDDQNNNNSNNVDSGLSSTAGGFLAGTAGALLGAAIEALKNADKSKPPAPTAPSAKAVQNMDEDETESAYDDFSKNVIQMHTAPSKADLAQTDMCAQFMAMTGEMGPDALKMKDDLNAMGAKMDKVSQDIAKGDVKSAAKGLDELSGDQAGLSAKMEASGIPQDPNDVAMVKEANEMYSSAQALKDNADPGKVADLNGKVDALDGSITDYEDQFKGLNDESKEKLMAQVTAGTDKITSDPKFVAMKEQTDKVNSLGKEVSKYDCSSFHKQGLEKLKTEAEKLDAQIPRPQDELQEKIADVQAKADAVKARANALKDQKPELTLQDPGLQDALNNLNASADGLASSVHGQCPICSASQPDMPAVPNCGHNHADALKMNNPFHMPSLKINMALNLLSGLNIDLPIPPIVNKLKSMKSRLESMNPLQSIPNPTNPYSVLKSTVDATKKRVLAAGKNLANCPDLKGQYESQLQSAQGSLESSQKKLQALMESDTTGDTKAKFAALQDSMKKNMAGQKGKAMSAAQQKQQRALAGAQAMAMGKVTSSFACWQAMNLPDIGGAGKPNEVIISMFKVKCPMSLAGPMPVLVKPAGTMQVEQKDALVINGVPLNQILGQCQHPMLWIKTPPVIPPPPPCPGVMAAVGGSMLSKNNNLPIGTKKMTQCMCQITGTKINILDTGQTPGKKPVTTS